MATVHFQQGLSLAQLLPYYGTEAEGYRALYNMIEPEAPRRLEKRDGMPPANSFAAAWRRTLTGSTHAMPFFGTGTHVDNVPPTDWCEHRFAPGAEVYSDGPACFTRRDTRTVLATEGRRAVWGCTSELNSPVLLDREAVQARACTASRCG